MTRPGNPRHLTDDQTRIMREAYGRDVCVCEHRRELHYANWTGSTVGCRREVCACSSYSYDRRANADFT